MRSGSRKKFRQNLIALDNLVEKYSLLILGAILTLTTYQKWILIQHTNGGGDLLGADIPKSMMLIAGQDPYASNPWASPYPPLLLAFVGAIIRITTGSITLTPDNIFLISRNIRTVGLAADATVAIVVYLALRARSFSGLSSLVPASIYVLLPSISLSPYYWFNSDVFGYPILAGSVFALMGKRYLLGATLLSLATIFKIHPILAIPLVLLWMVRKRGLSRTIPSILSSSSILAFGLVVPVVLPGYLGSILGFNLSSGFGAGTSSFTMMNVLYTTLPSTLNVSLPLTVENQIWMAVTAATFVFAFSLVWTRGKILNSADIVALGVLVWLIPLRQIYTHYLVWAVVPFLMRGRLFQTLLIGSLLEFANTMALWSWDLPPEPFPILATSIGFLATSIVYFSVSATALFFLVRFIGPSRRQVSPTSALEQTDQRSIPVTISA